MKNQDLLWKTFLSYCLPRFCAIIHLIQTSLSAQRRFLLLMMTPAKQERAQTIAKALMADVPSTKEVADLVVRILKAVQAAQSAMQADNSSTIKECKAVCAGVEKQLSDILRSIDRNKSGSDTEIAKTRNEFYKALSNEVYKLEQQIKNIEVYDDSLLETKWATVIGDIHSRIEDIKPFLVTPELVRDALENLSDDERLDISSVKGWEQVIEDLKKSGKNVRLVGGTNGIMVYTGTTKRGIIKYINFTGSGVSAGLVNGLLTLTFSGSGGSGYQQPTSGVVDGVNATFVWATAPSAIVVDGGRTIQKTSSDGTNNWSGTTTTILTVPPNFDVYAVA